LSTQDLCRRILEKMTIPMSIEDICTGLDGEFDWVEIAQILALLIREKKIGLVIVAYPWGVDFIYRKI
jgi:hypothetical protein